MIEEPLRSKYDKVKEKLFSFHCTCKIQKNAKYTY